MVKCTLDIKIYKINDIFRTMLIFVEIVSLFTQNGKVTVTGSIVRSFGVFHRCVAASNQCHVLCIRLHAQVIQLYLQKLLVGCTQNKV